MDEYFNTRFTEPLYVATGFGFFAGCATVLILSQFAILPLGPAFAIAAGLIALGMLIGAIIGAADCHAKQVSIFAEPYEKL